MAKQQYHQRCMDTASFICRYTLSRADSITRNLIADILFYCAHAQQPPDDEDAEQFRRTLLLELEKLDHDFLYFFVLTRQLVVENVNFTHLLEPEEVDPSQELLQKMSHFLVIFVSSEAERQFILSAPNRFKVNEHTICWILTEKHLGLAVPGTAMAEVWRIIQQHPANNLAYAFYALIQKKLCTMIAASLTSDTYICRCERKLVARAV